MKKAKKIAIYGMLIASVFAIGVFVFIQVLGEKYFPVNVTIMHEVANPDGRYIASVYKTDAGATTPFATNLAIRYRHDEFHRNRGRVLTVKGEIPLSVSWIGNELTVTAPKTILPEDVFRREETWNEVKLEYQGIEDYE